MSDSAIHTTPGNSLHERMSHFLALASPHLSWETAIATPDVAAIDLGRLLGRLQPLLADASRDMADASDIWAIIGLGRNEVQTARVLTWLLDPRGSHGMGAGYLSAFWERIPEVQRPFALAGARKAMRETVPLGDSKNRIDIEVEGDDFVLFVEVKVDAIEQPEQIQRYHQLAEKKAKIRGRSRFAVIFLAPFVPERLPTNCFHLRWSDVSAAIRSAHRNTGRTNQVAIALAVSFSQHVKRL